jgi:hypothetical protein
LGHCYGVKIGSWSWDKQGLKRGSYTAPGICFGRLRIGRLLFIFIPWDENNAAFGVIDRGAGVLTRAELGLGICYEGEAS